MISAVLTIGTPSSSTPPVRLVLVSTLTVKVGKAREEM